MVLKQCKSTGFAFLLLHGLKHLLRCKLGWSKSRGIWTLRDVFPKILHGYLARVEQSTLVQGVSMTFTEAYLKPWAGAVKIDSLEDMLSAGDSKGKV